jgi:hypothetical protein
MKGTGRAALHIPPNVTDLEPTELVCGDIKKITASTKMKEMHVFCEKYLLSTEKKNSKTAVTA